MRQNKTWRLDSQIWLDPGEPKLLLMNDAVAIHDLFNQILALVLIHAPNVMELFGICCHEVPGKDTHTHLIYLLACLITFFFFFLKLFLLHYNMTGKQWNKDQKQNSLKTGRHHIRLSPPSPSPLTHTHIHTHARTHARMHA